MYMPKRFEEYANKAIPHCDRCGITVPEVGGLFLNDQGAFCSSCYHADSYIDMDKDEIDTYEDYDDPDDDYGPEPCFMCGHYDCQCNEMDGPPYDEQRDDPDHPANYVDNFFS